MSFFLKSVTKRRQSILPPFAVRNCRGSGEQENAYKNRVRML